MEENRPNRIPRRILTGSVDDTSSKYLHSPRLTGKRKPQEVRMPMDERWNRLAEEKTFRHIDARPVRKVSKKRPHIQHTEATGNTYSEPDKW